LGCENKPWNLERFCFPWLLTRLPAYSNLFSNMSAQSFTGTLTALITPFRDGQISFDDLEALVNRQIEAGISGLVPCGTTGESPTLDHEEHIDVIRAVVSATQGRVPGRPSV
jgi:hypothetical protein